MNLSFDMLPTPIGPFILVYAAPDQAPNEPLVYADFADNVERRTLQLARRYPGFTLTEREGAGPMRDRFERYFAGDPHAFEPMSSLERAGLLSPLGSAIQKEVWTALRSIPVGTTQSYGALASQIGRNGAARAVGRINGQNPLSVVVPCHRVIGASGQLTGYAGGIERKRWLLEHERAMSPS